MTNKLKYRTDVRRSAVVVTLLAISTVFLSWRAIELHILNKDFLQGQGENRYLRVVSVPAHRGKITDRYGEPLAISTPIESVWADPRLLLNNPAQWPNLQQILQLNAKEFKQRLYSHKDKEFVYLKRHVAPDIALKVRNLAIPGVALLREYRRFYPAGEVAAHVVGRTDTDGKGLEGIELAHDEKLRSIPGSKRVIKDRYGRIVENVEQVSEPHPGQDVVLSIDRRIQYLAYRELKAAVIKHQATSGSAVIIDALSGEVLAMVNQPSYNPNNRGNINTQNMRNRAVTDVFEPGSTIKPFVIVAALETGEYEPDTLIDTEPGFIKVGKKIIRDTHNYGEINIAKILQKSSNVGASKIALSIEPQQLWRTLHDVGFGQPTGCNFPGEASGKLSDFSGWKPLERASLSFGYGMSATTLQLAQAYAALAYSRYRQPVTLLRQVSPQNGVDKSNGAPFSQKTIEQIKAMLELVVLKGGTGTKAQVPGYRIAGKTGTVKKTGKNGYLNDSYVSLFAGMAPVSAPRLVMVVMINDPRGEEYYGGSVAAPVFAKVMAGALRMLDVPPDNLPTLKGTRLVALMDHQI